MPPLPTEKNGTMSHVSVTLSAPVTEAASDAPGLVKSGQDASADGPAAEACVRPPTRFLDRDHSILAFNERVFDWVARKDVPLLERLRFLSIVSSNLDEFFEVRAEPHITAARNGETKGPTPSLPLRHWPLRPMIWWSGNTPCTTRR